MIITASLGSPKAAKSAPKYEIKLDQIRKNKTFSILVKLLLNEWPQN